MTNIDFTSVQWTDMNMTNFGSNEYGPVWLNYRFIFIMCDNAQVSIQKREEMKFVNYQRLKKDKEV